MELQGGDFRLFWGYFGPLGANQTTLSYSLAPEILTRDPNLGWA